MADLPKAVARRSKGLPEFFFPFDDQPSFERYLASIWGVLPFQKFDLAALRREDSGPTRPLLRKIALPNSPT